MKKRCMGFTIIELLVVISIIALLIGILLPAVGKARDNARVAASRSNIRQLGVALNSYAADWEDRQYTPVRDTLGQYDSVGEFNQEVYGGGGGNPNVPIAMQVHPGIAWGYAYDGGLYGYWMHNAGYHWALHAINFTGGTQYFGWFRFPQTKAINSYLGGRCYDQVFYAPKDRLSLAAAEPCMDEPGEFALNQACNDPGPVWTSYCLSPASMFSPSVMRNEADGGWQSPWDLPSGFRCPSMSQIRYPTLKTHILEHQWLQNPEVQCNPAFSEFGTVLDCEPYYFNHGLTSSPVTLFYDAHVQLVGAHEAMLADRRVMEQLDDDYGLWSRDTPFGDNGYLIDIGYDFAETSFHILTTDGAFGRDILGKE